MNLCNTCGEMKIITIPKDDGRICCDCFFMANPDLSATRKDDNINYGIVPAFRQPPDWPDFVDKDAVM